MTSEDIDTAAIKEVCDRAGADEFLWNGRVVSALLARISTLEAALTEALDKYDGLLAGRESPTYLEPTEGKLARLKERSAELRALASPSPTPSPSA